MEKTKRQISISIDRNIFNLVNKNMTNYSKYIEWLIYQDLKRNNINGIDNIII